VEGLTPLLMVLNEESGGHAAPAMDTPKADA
jgi:hypothetical protein